MLHDVCVEVWGQRVIRFFDPEGNLIEYGESIPCFVRRLHEEGLDAGAVARKTGVALEQVRAMLA